MRRYRQPKAGTPDAMNRDSTRLVNKDSNPIYFKRQNIIENIKQIYQHGDTSDYEWQ